MPGSILVVRNQSTIQEYAAWLLHSLRTRKMFATAASHHLQNHHVNYDWRIFFIVSNRFGIVDWPLPLLVRKSFLPFVVCWLCPTASGYSENINFSLSCSKKPIFLQIIFRTNRCSNSLWLLLTFHHSNNNHSAQTFFDFSQSISRPYS